MPRLAVNVSATTPTPARFCGLGARAGWSSRRPCTWHKPAIHDPFWYGQPMRTTGGRPMKIMRKDALVAIIANIVLLLVIHTTEAGQDSPPLSSVQIIEILSSPARTAADRKQHLP